MIEKQRLEELIEQGATIYVNNSYQTYELNMSYFVNIEIINEVLYCGTEIIPLEQLFETKEDAEWQLEFGNIQRTETLKLPKWEEFCKRKYVSFSDEFCNHYELELSKYSTVTITKYPCDWVIYEKPLTKENYIKACRLCLRLFKGEEV